MIRRIGISVLILAALSTTLAAQTAAEHIQTGDAAAAADRHDEAIAAYERALAQEPALRTELSAKLGRQHLWKGDHARAVALLGEFVGAHPQDCDVRFDYAMALSWNNDLRDALREYERLTEACPARRHQAWLHMAQVYRWQDRPTAAQALYQRVLAEGSDAERRDARVALGFVELDKDNNRAASKVFHDEHAVASSPSVDEGAVIAAVRLGEPSQVETVLARAAAAGSPSRDLLDVASEWQLRDRPWLTPRINAFRDADGTTYLATELAASLGWSKRGRGELAVGRSTLSLDDQDLEDQWVSASIEHRFSPTFAIVAGGRLHDYDEIDFQPVTGEVNLIFTPSDRVRLDASAARVIIGDNFAALHEELAGNYAGAGIDYRLTFRTTATASADVTRWNSDNERQRFRFNLVHRFEGTPRVTLSWPSLYQRYDEPFAFNLFSPRRYVETGPAVNVYRRFAKVWNAAGYLRGGVQQEETFGWKRLATARVSLARDLHDAWAFEGALMWTNSNLASSTGFRRTSASLTLSRRF